MSQIPKNHARFTLEEIGEACGEKSRWQNNWQMQGVATDSRIVENGHIFVALKGENFDGHAFLSQIARLPKIFAVVSDSDAANASQIPHILVPDTQKALGVLARFHRQRFEIPVVAVTGSYGKTTTRALIGAALKSEREILTSEGNFNNEIGLPMTLFGLEVKHQVAVVEMGMRGPKQIEYLAQIALPTVAVITNVGPQHVELLGSVEEIAKAKAEILENLPPDGLAVLPADSPFLEFLKSRAKCKIVTFGTAKNADYRAQNIETNAEGTLDFQVFLSENVKSEEELEITIENPALESESEIFVDEDATAGFQISLPLSGNHNAVNAAAAFAVAHQLGIAPQNIIRGLENAVVPGARMRVLKLGNNVKIIDDCYNAGPDSTRAALQTLLDFPGFGRKIAVLGAMKELGDFSESEHAKIGRFAGTFCEVLVGVGGETRPLLNSALAAAKEVENPMQIFWCENAQEAKSRVGEWIGENDMVLVKGSRSVGLEVVVEELRALFGSDA